MSATGHRPVILGAARYDQAILPILKFAILTKCPPKPAQPSTIHRSGPDRPVITAQQKSAWSASYSVIELFQFGANAS